MAAQRSMPARAVLTDRQRSQVVPTVVLSLLLVALVTGIIWSTHQTSPTYSATVPTNPAVEAKWGVRVTQIGVTADGGMVDFRFVILNADKAADMMLNVKNLPVLVDEQTGTKLTSTVEMGDDHSYNVGQTYFMLYRNTEGVVHSGSPVTAQFVGNLTIQHILAR